jgi:hypothetical protein
VTTFVAVSDHRYFPGAVMLINSLRISGNEGPIILFDSGLTADQRDRLHGHCTVVPVDVATIRHPMLLKPLAADLGLKGTVIQIDTDVIVTADLSDVAARAAAGRILAFPDLDDDRWFAEWEGLFGLPATPRRQTYLTSHFLAFSTDHWPWLLARWRAGCERVPVERTRGAGAPEEDPFWDSDQDALNAILMSSVGPEDVEVLAREAAPSYADPLARVRVRQKRALRCTLDGQPVLMLHHAPNPKAWLPDAASSVERNAFTRLAARVATAPDVAIRLRPDELPVWLRPGLVGPTALTALGTVNRSRRFVRTWLLPRLRQRVRGKARR